MKSMNMIALSAFDAAAPAVPRLHSRRPHWLLQIAAAFSAAGVFAQPDQEASPASDAKASAPGTTLLHSTALRHRASLAIEGERRIIRSNGWPDHEPGQFPRRGNPNRLAGQNHRFEMPLKPAPAERPTPTGRA